MTHRPIISVWSKTLKKNVTRQVSCLFFFFSPFHLILWYISPNIDDWYFKLSHFIYIFKCEAPPPPTECTVEFESDISACQTACIETLSSEIEECTNNCQSGECLTACYEISPTWFDECFADCPCEENCPEGCPCDEFCNIDEGKTFLERN